MKHPAIMLGVLAMLALVAGCERQKEADDPAAYDPAIDGPRCSAAVHVDPNLVADQATISKAAEKAGETPAETPGVPTSYVPVPESPTPYTPSPSGDKDIDQVKRVVGRLITAAKAKDFESIYPLLVKEDADTLRPILAEVKVLVEKARGIETYVKSKLGVDLRDKGNIDDMFEGIPGAPVKLSLATAKFKKESDGAIIVTGGQGQLPPLRFIKRGNSWKQEFTALDKQIFGLSKEIFQASHKFMDRMKAGIESGDITKDNLDAKMDALGNEILEPVMKKMMEIIFPDMPGELKIEFEEE